MFSGGEEVVKAGLNGSERHREVWNFTAKEMGYPIQWVQDGGMPHVVDPVDLEIAKEDRAKFGLTETGAIQKTPSLWKAVDEITSSLETTRQRLLGDSLARRKEVASLISISHLTGGEKKLLEFVRSKIIPLINQLRFLQADPRLEGWRMKIEKEGNLLSRKQWERRLDDNCHETISDLRCSVFPYFPNKRPEYNENPVWTTIPSDITKADEVAMKKLWQGDPKLNPYFSPFTVVERDGNGSFKWTAMSIHPMTSGLIRSLSEAFAQGSKIPGIAPSLSKQLGAWSEALKSKEAYPFDKAERATVWQDEGNLEISLDVSPNYTSFGKSGIQLIGGVVRAGADVFARQHVRPVLQVLEAELGDALLGVYVSRKLRDDIPVRFVDSALRDANLQQIIDGEVLAYAFPSGTKIAEEEGSAKRVALMNNIALKFEHIYKPLAGVALDPEQLPLLTSAGDGDVHHPPRNVARDRPAGGDRHGEGGNGRAGFGIDQ